ncbi:MAG: PDZ domain-containing protein [Spirochaetia bacterium]|jgi:S1-C subfamily serine protease
MRLQFILVGVLSLALGATLGFAQPKAEKPAGTTEAVNPNNQPPVSEPGVLVVAVQSDSPAQKAGIVRGDIILALNGTAVNTPAELIKSIEAHKTGDSVAVKLRHGDAEKTANVVLAERNGRAWMGTALFPGGRERGRALGDDQEFGYQFPFSGAYVTSVVPGSPAEKAGLKQGDVILSVDGTNVDPRHSLADLIGAKKIGDTVTLSVGSSAPGQGQSPPRDVKVTLDKNPTSNVPYAGIQYTAAPPRFGRGPRGGAFTGPGVFVADVVADGPASKAGIKPRDVITKIQGVAVTDPKEVADAVAAHKPGDTLSVTVRSGADDKEADISVTLGANPNDASKAYMGISMSAFMGLPGPGQRGFGGMPRRMTPPDNAPPGI